MPAARASATLLATEVQVGGRPQRAIGQLTPQKLIDADAVAAARAQQKRFCHHPPNQPSVPPDNRLHCTPGPTQPIKGSPPAFCGRLLTRFLDGRQSAETPGPTVRGGGAGEPGARVPEPRRRKTRAHASGGRFRLLKPRSRRTDPDQRPKMPVLSVTGYPTTCPPASAQQVGEIAGLQPIAHHGPAYLSPLRSPIGPPSRPGLSQLNPAIVASKGH